MKELYSIPCKLMKYFLPVFLFFIRLPLVFCDLTENDHFLCEFLFTGLWYVLGYCFTHVFIYVGRSVIASNVCILHLARVYPMTFWLYGTTLFLLYIYTMYSIVKIVIEDREEDREEDERCDKGIFITGVIGALFISIF